MVRSDGFHPVDDGDYCRFKTVSETLSFTQEQNHSKRKMACDTGDQGVIAASSKSTRAPDPASALEVKRTSVKGSKRQIDRTW